MCINTVRNWDATGEGIPPLPSPTFNNARIFRNDTPLVTRMQRNVDEIPRQYKQAENNNFPEVPLKGGNSNNGLRTGSRFPAPGLFRSGRELRYEPTDNIKPHFETHANIRTPTPFPSPREERRK